MKKLSWKPIRRGQIYCSPACGANCKHSDYLKCFTDGKAAISRLKTTGWKLNVWENMGWHFCLVNTKCAMSIHASGLTFWCMDGGGDGTECSSGHASLNASDSFKDPNKAQGRCSHGQAGDAVL